MSASLNVCSSAFIDWESTETVCTSLKVVRLPLQRGGVCVTPAQPAVDGALPRNLAAATFKAAVAEWLTPSRRFQPR